MAEEEKKESSKREEELTNLSNYEILISGGSITLVGLGKCIVAGARYALKTMYNIVLEEKPEVSTTAMELPPRVVCSKEMYAALITLKHAQVHGTGFVFVYILKSSAKRFLEEAGVIQHATESELVDACGELCNLIAGAFKAEVKNLGLGLIQISPPKLFPNGVEEVIEGVEQDLGSKYTLNIHHKGQYLLTIEVAFKSEHG